MKPLRSSRAWEASKADSAPGQLSAPAAVSFPDEMLILVDQDGRSIGEASKQQCHEGRGLLHRAFSLLIFDQKGRLLLQQRAAGKLLWPGYWSNSCCSHPRTGEGLAAAARRRSREELGLSVDPELLFTFQYSATYRNIGSENEVCAVFAAASSLKVAAAANVPAAMQEAHMSVRPDTAVVCAADRAAWARGR